MTPRDVIAYTIPGTSVELCFGLADAIIKRLQAAGYVILPAAEAEKIERALRRAEDGAGTLPAKDSVKLVPTDWHALGEAIRALKGAKP